MANPIAFQNLYFERLTDFPTTVVCRECRYSVWPSQIESHLQHAHRYLSSTLRKQLAEEVRSWPDIAINPIELDIPPTRIRAIPQLIGPLNGWQCQLSPELCWYYFAIIDHHDVEDERDRMDEANSISLPNAAIFWEQANAKFAEFEKKLVEKIAQGHVDEANPWLRRTGWLPYLKPFTFHALQAFIEAPEPPSEDENQSTAIPDTKTAEKCAAWAVWSAMGEVGRLSQLSVLHMGVFVRMEAICSERNQTRYQPLEAYQDANAVTDRVFRPGERRPWESRSIPSLPPSSGESRVETMAPQRVRPRGEEEMSDRSRDRLEGDADPEEVDPREDDDEEYDEENKEEEEVPPLTPIQQACLDFCIELLNQRIVRREYDSALICATAILGA
ncbi:hypothetical protein TSTA_023250 [Talaromyces stipitatus ATCC 10500]|uniref:Uncharacterized protein n=1 Tax=Talaromyces stipitatus (strain ATCC 10500 / CBS 375.48 / QM 6759 / NRRL 1006) TaxID=441959 RepID=B8MEY8_TALSN|nr:uncharacterized protein TSTA_023250 [Talaromyces stipitatus ATCC 10500]EED17271.1 hypothetical protein TSTA_023250 [Talaromyces stipitatus ATCC 10500]